MKKRIILLLAALCAALMATAAALQSEQHALAAKLIRLHVVANSDSAEDQWIKLQVRDAVLTVTEPLARSNDPETALQQALPQIREAANHCLQDLGCSDRVVVSLGQERFPTRVYESFSLPSGVYRSLRVTIGDGAGQNWWCVAFPSICFRATAADLEEAAAAAGFSGEEVRLITEDGPVYRLKFRALELLQLLKERIFT